MYIIKTLVFFAALLLWATGLILIGKEFTGDFNLSYIYGYAIMMTFGGCLMIAVKFDN